MPLSAKVREPGRTSPVLWRKNKKNMVIRMDGTVMNTIEFYLAFRLKKMGENHLPRVGNEIRKCLFDKNIITSGRQFYIYVNAEQDTAAKNSGISVKFLCKIETDTELQVEDLAGLLEPAFLILNEREGLTDFKIKQN